MKVTFVDLMFRWPDDGPHADHRVKKFRVRVPGFILDPAAPNLVLHHVVSTNAKGPDGLKMRHWAVTEARSGLSAFVASPKATKQEAAKEAWRHLRLRLHDMECKVDEMKREKRTPEHYPLLYTISARGNVKKVNPES